MREQFQKAPYDYITLKKKNSCSVRLSIGLENEIKNSVDVCEVLVKLYKTEFALILWNERLREFYEKFRWRVNTVIDARLRGEMTI